MKTVEKLNCCSNFNVKYVLNFRSQFNFDLIIFHEESLERYNHGEIMSDAISFQFMHHTEHVILFRSFLC